jgi:alkyl hydroperoxide reductase subunit AhpC
MSVLFRSSLRAASSLRSLLSPTAAAARCLSTTSSVFSARVQHPAPDFTCQAVVNGQFKEISLADFRGKYLVLYFYPLDFTFVCPTEIIAFSDRMKEFEAIDCAVVGMSTDSHFSHLAWINLKRKEGGLGGLSYPLAADFNKKISEDYGVLVEGAGIALRGLFIIDPQVTLIVYHFI